MYFYQSFGIKHVTLVNMKVKQTKNSLVIITEN